MPCYNEAVIIKDTYTRIKDVAETRPDFLWEFVFVDDGSTDSTYNLLLDINQSDPRVKVISLSRNFGHQVAVTAGVEVASGDAVVIIDSDLQDPPEVIPAMLEKWQAGFDVVYGQRVKRQGESFFKLITAFLFYRIINKMSEISIPLDTGDFRLINRRVVEAFKAMPERDRFIRGLVSWCGYKQCSVQYTREKRFAGNSKYNVSKMLPFAMDGILSFSRKPLFLVLLLGGILSMLGVALGMLLLIFNYTGYIYVNNLVWLVIFITFISGIHIICLGIIGEYIGRIYGEVKGRPLYFIKEKIGF